MTKTQAEKNEQSFESGIARLEELIQHLEEGEADLDRSLALFEEGIKLSRQLNRKLDQAEKKLELLLKDENGRPMARELLLEEEETEAG